jgi:hypothetical protein
MPHACYPCYLPRINRVRTAQPNVLHSRNVTAHYENIIRTLSQAIADRIGEFVEPGVSK